MPSDGRSRAKTYLRRIASLTGAKRMGNRYIVKVGKSVFHVRDRYVWRLPDSTNPNADITKLAFVPFLKGIPREEEIASVLLQLRNNPALFDKWVRQNGLAFEADRQVVPHVQ